MAVNGRFGGHIVSGHVDGTGRIQLIKKEKNAVYIHVDVSKSLTKYMILKGSITAVKREQVIIQKEAETINKVCASGLRALSLADQIIRSGDEQVIVAGGMESMSHAPYLNKAMRWGAKMGDIKMHDSMLTDGLTCAFTGVHMGCYGNETANKFNITREAQDEWALRSHSLAIKAQEQGHGNYW